VQAHEKDRFFFESKLESLRVKQREAHQIEWELKKRTEEQRELQMALERCQNVLGTERGTIEEMVVGGENLKLKQKLNKKKIMELLESSNSVEQHVYYNKDEKPEKIQQYYVGAKHKPIVGAPNTMAPITYP
jgi:hypothetical protein